MERLRTISESMARLRTELAKVFVGQEEAVELLLVALLAGGHAMLTGVPGLGKTKLVRSVSALLGLSFRRIQFTPDLMPADIIGGEILEQDPETGRRAFRFQEGPIFTQFLLADEINRTPPKTQAALLEAMGERRSLPQGQPDDSRSHSSSSQRKTNWNSKGHTHSPRHSWTGSS